MTQYTALFTIAYVFVVMEIGTRRIVRSETSGFDPFPPFAFIVMVQILPRPRH